MSPVSDRGGALSLDDCRCPVCLEIFMEPVTLPCTHTFCKACFLESVDKATLCCPLCRKRVSTWARLHSRNNTLVNQQLWTRIQTTFPLQCQRRLSGQDAANDDDLGVPVCVPRVSQPGELRQEYEDQVTKLTEEKRVLDEEQRRASEEYIQRLLQEEEKLLQEERKRREEDEGLARLLSNQLNSAGVSQENVRPDVTPAKKKKKKEVIGGQMDRFLSPRTCRSSSDCSSASRFTDNKENILLPQTDHYEPPDLHPTPLSPSEEEQQLHLRSHLTSDGGPSSSKRKSSEDEEETVSKRVRPSCEEVGGSVLQGLAEREEELLSRQRQEEEDWRLAQLLQKELDQEEKMKATDRRKGSSDAYLLRRNHRGKRGEEEAGSSSRPSTPSRPSSSSSGSSSVKTAKTSSSSGSSSVKTAKTSSSSSSSSRGSKQTTLTEMFSSLSS